MLSFYKFWSRQSIWIEKKETLRGSEEIKIELSSDFEGWKEDWREKLTLLA